MHWGGELLLLSESQFSLLNRWLASCLSVFTVLLVFRAYRAYFDIFCFRGWLAGKGFLG
jgi:hypothetical protein